MRPRRARLVFLLDVDNTLLDNDRVERDLRRHLLREVGRRLCGAYWRIFERRRKELGYADYLGSLQDFRAKHTHEARILTVSKFMLDYRFDRRLFPGALRAVRALRRRGKTVILSDGDAVFQTHKIEVSGLDRATGERELIYIHKERELRDVARRYPALHYVLVDDKLRILDAVKRQWKDRVTTVFVKQGHYATDPKNLRKYPPADVAIGRIAELASPAVLSRLGL